MTVTITKNIFDAEGNISITRKNDETMTFTIKTSAGVAIDITGYTIYFTVKDKTDDTVTVIAKVVTVHTDPTAGETEVTLTNTDTDIAVDVYRYDVAWLDATSKYETFITNRKFSITQNIL